MKYWEQETSVLLQPEMAAADSLSIGVWMRILNYCAIQENGGRIVNAAVTLATDRALISTLGITREELRHAIENSTIVFMDGPDLCIKNYCHREQTTLEARRVGGKKGGRPPAETSRKPPVNLPATEVIDPETSPSRVREGKERKGKGEDSARGAVSPDGDTHPSNSFHPETDSFADEKVRAAARIVNRYPRTGGDAMHAQLAIVRSLESGATGAEILAGVEAHAVAYRRLPAGLQQFCPGRQKYFEGEEWRNPATGSPWIDPEASPSDSAQKKNKSAAETETERRRMSIVRELWPHSTGDYDDLTPEQKARVQSIDRERRAA